MGSGDKVEYRVLDQLDGRYVVEYLATAAGSYALTLSCSRVGTAEQADFWHSCEGWNENEAHSLGGGCFSRALPPSGSSPTTTGFNAKAARGGGQRKGWQGQDSLG